MPIHNSYIYSLLAFSAITISLISKTPAKLMEAIQALPVAVTGPAVALGGITLWFIKAYANDQKRKSSNLPPEVPGWPVIGNLLQLKEKKPHRTFTKWAEMYGPIYSIRTGASKMVVLNSNDVVKEAMVTKYSSISTRKLSKALTILTSDKSMVAMSDYNDFYKEAKKILLTSTLGTNAQKKLRVHRDTLVENISAQLQQCCENTSEAINFRSIFQPELFSLSLKEAIGKDVESIYVEELGGVIPKKELFKILVQDQMEGSIEVDWRDFFPYLKWIPNKSFEEKIQLLAKRRDIAIQALGDDHKKNFKIEQEGKCYLDFLLKEGKSFTEKQILNLSWETIIEASDTTMVLTEWAMYELAKNRDKQDRLYDEIHKVCGANKVTEENLCQLPYLSAIFQETLRLHCPVPVVPLRYVHEDTELGGYNVPAGTEIAINIYGCNLDKNVWESPNEWKPERFLNRKSENLELHKIAAFGGGKRVCAGALQAMLISCISIARLVQQFEWGLSGEEEDNEDTVGLTNQKLHPLHAIIRPRT